ncbi:hypothetical protein NEF87_001239 [Candidatus Lokiarchaeum ossiferum]|uniref:Nucleotide-diphospho-sugar transferase domain-containing protein n=1 Tax=Candidatus Lokiarchaeum ossiferum TaxID=2951803 RepID=A0ABY6HR44_9ARCH|nr:hypothetical protein NEF87_001239 [Candidatus Lokiarchaeum sp. B-35]
MYKLIYAFRSTKIDFRTILLAASIRSFAGKLNECPIIIAYNDEHTKISHEHQQILKTLNVSLISFQLSKDFHNDFFADFVKAAGIIEKKVYNETENLVWLGPDTLIFKEPTHFLLPEGIKIGYRPVHHINIGSLFGSPIDDYWNLIFRLCEVPTERFFPMETHVDLDIIRPYFNAGSIITRPKEGLFQIWWEKYQQWHQNKEYLELCKVKPANRIFFHQAILSGLILNRYTKNSLLKLPKNYNYPLHLHTQNSRKDKPKDFEDMITIRYENRDILENIALPNHIKTWISKELSKID